MKRTNRTKILAAAAVALALSPLSAKDVTLNWGDGQTVTVDIPDDIAGLVEENREAIEEKLEENGKTAGDVESAIDDIRSEYDKLAGDGITMPYTTITGGLNDFTETLTDVIPNTQLIQNVWANSWIGYLIPKLNFGFGINAGASMMDITSLKNAASALKIDTGDLPDNLVLPTATADARIGGFILPFDIGFTVSSINTEKLGLEEKIKPAAVDFFTVGGDFRYAILKTSVLKARVSLSGGAYYTKGSISVDDKDESGAKASLDFESTTLFAGAQASA